MKQKNKTYEKNKIFRDVSSNRCCFVRLSLVLKFKIQNYFRLWKKICGSDSLNSRTTKERIGRKNQFVFQLRYAFCF